MASDKNTEDPSEENTKYKQGVNHNARLIVRNISFKATEESFREHFSTYGRVEEVKLLKTPNGRLIGCGFVHFTQVPMANKALAATNKKPFLGEFNMNRIHDILCEFCCFFYYKFHSKTKLGQSV